MILWKVSQWYRRVIDLKNFKICIDAGHNYSAYDTGAVGNGLKEQNVTFEIANKLKELLTKAGVEVIMTRAKLTDNVGINAKNSINERARIANSTNCDYFISIHCNAGGGTGTETLIYGIGGKAEPLAEAVNDKIVKYFKLRDRGVKVRTDLGVLRLTDMPAILVETAFIDNKSDAELLKNCTVEFARCIYEGVCDYIGIGKNDVNDESEPEQVIKIDNASDIVHALSYMIDITDPEKAILEVEKAKSENSSLYWILYKIVNGVTPECDILAPEQGSVDIPSTAKYSIIGTTHIIEVDPRKIWAVETQCSTKNISYANFVNSLFFMNLANGGTHPLGIMVNAGKVIANNPTHGKPVATLIIYGKDNVQLKYVDDITKEKNV